MRKISAVFLDDGGVLNDNRRRSRVWERQVGVFFSERFGGTPTLWGEANRRAFEAAWRTVGSRPDSYADYDTYLSAYYRAWMARMFQEAGQAMPLSDAEAVRVADACARFATRQDAAAIPGAAEAVRAMHRAGLRLHMASGTHSALLDIILERMGIRGCFVTLCGPDLIGLPKSGPDYYRAVLAHAGEPPEAALIIESDEAPCGWARAAGAEAIQCHIERGETLAAVVRGRLGC